ncbi:hypothetical protein [Legionella sp. km772]|uniref:hypothetical protein n=1 Tax=Legionella sp. km772 TaxID=2498111 RepID=UPI000F8D1942|nr:hypothetical protein [Legionella sp. km772]RUR08415.1 hypothetical protein ELY15_10940 [Legionella sp. km772]
MPLKSKDIPQFTINYICSCLLMCRIRTTDDLSKQFYALIAQISQNPDVFKTHYTVEECCLILETAIKAYNNANDFAIRMSKVHRYAFSDAEQHTHLFSVVPIDTADDLSHVTKSYDQFIASQQIKKKTNKLALSLLENAEYIETQYVIFGAGDTGTTIWLEKYKLYHEVALQHLQQGKTPPILMLAQDAGNWHHDYTLAQPHNILERTHSQANPSDYMSSSFYAKNPYTNARHVYQANQVILTETGAPLLQATVLKIEKQEHHASDWTSTSAYRLVISTSLGKKLVYTNEIDVCTGLGPAKTLIPNNSTRLAQLTQYDSEKGFIPLIDGNQYILTDEEERSPKSKTIVIYGGGGTAAACYRKGFFGHDVRTESVPMEENGQKNKMLWVAKQFNKAGTGKLVTHALKSAKERDELLYAELIQITPKLDGTLFLQFKTMDTTDQKIISISCDQFIYSVGQDDNLMRQICHEIETDLNLNFDNKMVLNVESSNHSVRFFGAAAMAVRELEYMTATWSWLRSQNIGGDVGPGSMPPSRAQIKRYNALNGIPPQSINANMDTMELIIEFLEKAGVPHSVALEFSDDLLFARKQSPSGANYKTIKSLLIKHQLRDYISIEGHGHLIIKLSSESTNIKQVTPLLSWLGEERRTNDASITVSNATATGQKEFEELTVGTEPPTIALLS